MPRQAKACTLNCSEYSLLLALACLSNRLYCLGLPLSWRHSRQSLKQHDSAVHEQHPGAGEPHVGARIDPGGKTAGRRSAIPAPGRREWAGYPDALRERGVESVLREVGDDRRSDCWKSPPMNSLTIRTNQAIGSTLMSKSRPYACSVPAWLPSKIN